MDVAAGIDSDVVAVIDLGLDMMAVIDSEQGAADSTPDTSERVTVAVVAGLVVTDSVMALQDVVAVVSSDWIVAIDKDVMAVRY